MNSVLCMQFSFLSKFILSCAFIVVGPLCPALFNLPNIAPHSLIQSRQLVDGQLLLQAGNLTELEFFQFFSCVCGLVEIVFNKTKH